MTAVVRPGGRGAAGGRECRAVMGKIHIKMVPDAELAAWLAARGQPVFRHRQIRDWLYRRWALTFEQMHNLPLPLRQELAADFVCCSVTPRRTQTARHGTVKILFALQDGETIETVQLRARRRTTACVSTQVGCPVRCVFCASGRLVTLEYTLLRGRNDADADMVRLAAVAAELRAKVNLIACNPTQAAFTGPDAGELGRCRKRLQRLGVRCTVRRERGAEIRAACGQLRHCAEVDGSALDQ